MDHFSYLGQVIVDTDRCQAEIRQNKGITTAMFNNIKQPLTWKLLRYELKLNDIVYPTPLYGTEI